MQAGRRVKASAIVLKNRNHGTKITDCAFRRGCRRGESIMARIIVEGELCKGCYLCIHVCPKKSIRVSKKLNAKGYYPAEPDDTAECTGCESCMLVCPEMAVEVYDED
jgi:2-oxoglutarate ferredoxin oxidoreductase subunit delta